MINGQVVLWAKFPDLNCPSMPKVDRAQNQSVATLVRHQGGMTKEAAQLLVNVAWAGLVITLEFFGDQPLEATGIPGNRPVHVVLRGRKVGKFNEFDIESQLVLYYLHHLGR